LAYRITQSGFDHQEEKTPPTMMWSKARVDGKPRIVHQTYLGTAEGVAESGAPVRLAATTREFGLPGTLWLPAEN
jgi:hypothetical protein